MYIPESYGSSYVYADGPPVGSDRIVVSWVKVCVCGADALDDPALEDIESHLCSSCWLHAHGQAFADAMWEAIYE